MDPKISYTALKQLLDNQPNWAAFQPSSKQHQEWLGKASAHLKRWNAQKAESFTFQIGFMSTPGVLRDTAVTTFLGILNQAVFDLEIDIPSEGQQIFGPGAVYDFFKELNGLLATARSSILIVDPYLDSQIFDGYIGKLNTTVEVKMITNKNSADLKLAADRFNAQNKSTVEIKKSNELHDRAVIIDKSNCWVIGQSIKDAAKSKQTYMVPVGEESGRLKIDHYYDVFSRALAI